MADPALGDRRRPLFEQQRYMVLHAVGEAPTVRCVVVDDDGHSGEGWRRVRDPLDGGHYRVPLGSLYYDAASAESDLAAEVLARSGVLAVYHDTSGSGTEWVIAHSREDAAQVYAGEMGEYHEEEYGPQFWHRLPPHESVEIWCDAGGHPTEPRGDGAQLVKETCTVWARRGRGYLCTTEI